MKKPASTEPIRSDKSFWTVKDAARYLGLRDTTLYDWIQPAKRRKTTIPSPPPPVYRFGTRRGIRFPIKEFIRWAENFRQE